MITYPTADALRSAAQQHYHATHLAVGAFGARGRSMARGKIEHDLGLTIIELALAMRPQEHLDLQQCIFGTNSEVADFFQVERYITETLGLLTPGFWHPEAGRMDASEVLTSVYAPGHTLTFRHVEYKKCDIRFVLYRTENNNFQESSRA